MCDVTRQNFDEKYPQIIDDLHSASFISIDCEFSGLFDDDRKFSLFDTPKARFTKLQSTMSNYLIIQFGLSTFRYERTNNSFVASTYNFYILPSSLFSANSKFTCHLDSIEFLCKHEFDFHKLFYDSVHFMNKVDEREALSMIQEKRFSKLINQEKIQRYLSQVSEWTVGSQEGSEMILNIDDDFVPYIYVLHQEIRRRFLNTWTYFNQKNVIKIKKISSSEKNDLLSNRDEALVIEKKIFDSLLGFSRVLKEIQNLKKPIVGHNFIIDLIMIYKQFYNPVPVTYNMFKRNILEIFPNLYDTKNISFKLRDILTRDNSWKSNCLSDLYDYFKNGKGATLVLFTPIIYHKDEDFLKEKSYHQAGFDSYCTGFCFLKMCHIFSLWDENKKSFIVTSMPTTSSWLLGAVTSMKNQMNISRAQVNYIALDGPDPKSTRPGLFYIRSKRNEPLDVVKISNIITKYTAVDVQLLNRYSGLMAIGNKRQVKGVLESFKNENEFTVSKYNILLHSNLGKVLIPSVVVSAAIVTIFLYKGNLKILN